MNFTHGQRVTGTAVNGKILHVGEFLHSERDALSGVTMGMVRWDGTDHDSLVPLERLSDEDTVTPAELHEMFVSDVQILWADWQRGHHTDEDALIAIGERLAGLREALKS